MAPSPPKQHSFCTSPPGTMQITAGLGPESPCRDKWPRHCPLLAPESRVQPYLIQCGEQVFHPVAGQRDQEGCLTPSCLSVYGDGGCQLHSVAWSGTAHRAHTSRDSQGSCTLPHNCYSSMAEAA